MVRPGLHFGSHVLPLHPAPLPSLPPGDASASVRQRRADRFSGMLPSHAPPAPPPCHHPHHTHHTPQARASSGSNMPSPPCRADGAGRQAGGEGVVAGQGMGRRGAPQGLCPLAGPRRAAPNRGGCPPRPLPAPASGAPSGVSAGRRGGAVQASRHVFPTTPPGPRGRPRPAGRGCSVYAYSAG